MKNSKIQKLLIEICLKIAKRGEGALFVIGNVEYKPLVEQKVPEFSIFDNPKLLESLALMDGAIIIDKNGYMKAYGVMIKSHRIFKNFGTRHSAAISASKDGNLVILVSEEDKKIRILQNRKMIMQIDALQRNIEKSIPEAVGILESVGVGTVGTIGAGILAPGLGLALLPGIIIFGSAYYLGVMIHKKIKKT